MALSLPILRVDSSPPPETLVRFFHRARLHWARHLAEEVPCETGTALVNPDQPAFNALLDAAVPAGWSAEAAIREAEAVFDSAGGCRRWILNPSAPPEQTQPLIKPLLAQGLMPHSETIWYLSNPAAPSISAEIPLKVLPARAAYTQAAQLAHVVAVEEGYPELAEAAMLHLDDGRYDALLALEGVRPVARVGVLAVGEIGLIEELYVVPERRGLGIGRMLLNRAMEIGARSQFRHLFIAANPRFDAAGMLTQAGFASIAPFIIHKA